MVVSLHYTSSCGERGLDLAVLSGSYWPSILVLFLECYLQFCMGGEAVFGKRSVTFLAMLASFYFLSQGWAMATQSPLTFSDNQEAEVQSEEVLGIKEILIPIFAGILSALRRVIARCVSLKNQLKRRLNAITIASATCFMLPVAMWDMIIGSANVDLPFSSWAFSSFVLFGIILIFYVDSIAEERLHMVFSSPRHLMVAGGCIIVMEIVYKMYSSNYIKVLKLNILRLKNKVSSNN